MSEVADAVVIGGGVIGASVAYHLARAGLRSVVVVEKRFLAAGATGKSAGLVRMYHDTEPDCLLAWHSLSYFGNWSEVVGGDCGFKRTGYVRIVSAHLEHALRADVEMQQHMGINTELVSGEDVSRLVPSLYTADFGVAAYEPDSGYADPTNTTAEFMGRARQMGARLRQDALAIGIRTTGDRVTGVTTQHGAIATPIVVNAAGAWAASIGRMVGLQVPVVAFRDEVLYLKRPAILAGPHPTVADDINGQYFRPEIGQLTLLGPWGWVDTTDVPIDPDNYREWVDNDFIIRMGERLTRRVPAMSEARVLRGQAGCDGLTPDKHSIIDQAGPEGFYLAVGHSGMGFKIAPAIGACMAELITQGRARTVDLAAFRLSRFAGGAHTA